MRRSHARRLFMDGLRDNTGQNLFHPPPKQRIGGNRSLFVHSCVHAVPLRTVRVPFGPAGVLIILIWSRYFQAEQASAGLPVRWHLPSAHLQRPSLRTCMLADHRGDPALDPDAVGKGGRQIDNACNQHRRIGEFRLKAVQPSPVTISKPELGSVTEPKIPSQNAQKLFADQGSG